MPHCAVDELALLLAALLPRKFEAAVAVLVKVTAKLKPKAFADENAVALAKPAVTLSIWAVDSFMGLAEAAPTMPMDSTRPAVSATILLTIVFSWFESYSLWSDMDDPKLFYWHYESCPDRQQLTITNYFTASNISNIISPNGVLLTGILLPLLIIITLIVLIFVKY